MPQNKSTIFFLIAAAALYFGSQHLSRTASETAILHIPPAARHQDTYVNIWVVDDEQRIWIRAESPDRLWLEYLADSPIVELQRADGTRGFRATLQDTDRTRRHVDALFRDKYGIADEVRALTRRKTIPIRLERP